MFLVEGYSQSVAVTLLSGKQNFNRVIFVYIHTYMLVHIQKT